MEADCPGGSGEVFQGGRLHERGVGGWRPGRRVHPSARALGSRPHGRSPQLARSGASVVQPFGRREEAEREDSEVEGVVGVAEIFGVFVLVNLIIYLLLERESRQLQWVRFNDLIRRADAPCRQAGWILVGAEFRPGWRWGRGSVMWQKGDDRHISPITVDAAETTRAAAKPW